MSRIVPFDREYKTIKQVELVASYALIFSSVSIFAIFCIKNNVADWMQNLDSKFWINTILRPLSLTLTVLYIVLTYLAKYLFRNAEKVKRDDLIDNSFGTGFAIESSSGYYNNDEVSDGVLKLSINIYESSFHTEVVLRKMLLNKSILAVVLSIPFLLSIFSAGGYNIIILLFEISMPVIILTELITLLVYYNNVKNINDRFKIELINRNSNEDSHNTNPHLLIPVIEYFNIKSWASLMLSTKVFEKTNEEISKKWIERKKKIGITS